METREEYIKSELYIYPQLKKLLKENEKYYKTKIERLERKLIDLQAELNTGNNKGIDYDYIPTTAVREPLLALLAQEEKYINELREVKECEKNEKTMLEVRIKHVDMLIEKLTDFEKMFIIDYYIKKIPLSCLVQRKEYNYSLSTLKRYKDKIITKLAEMSPELIKSVV